MLEMYVLTYKLNITPKEYMVATEEMHIIYSSLVQTYLHQKKEENRMLNRK